MTYFKGDLKTVRTSMLFLAINNIDACDQLLTDEALAALDRPAKEAHPVFVAILEQLADEIDRRMPIPEEKK